MVVSQRAFPRERWQWLAGGALYWLTELLLQTSSVPQTTAAPASVLLLAIPAALAVFFIIWSNRSWTKQHQQFRHRTTLTPTPTPKVDMERIRADLAILGDRRLHGDVSEEAFRIERDMLLFPVTHPHRPN
ncbi:hypothetical protein B7R22_01855 [Subtercola boreus]|uniref:Uncharacterized protein n=1 Tax=Subtercola boreus TaxID=120213 RepID=A0A3E0W787_9MICO|nr:hypothetical protein [Subtercola boreus]RFA17057.1 hypothetical protein B7R22_01855 [Subtercola boreus]